MLCCWPLMFSSSEAKKKSRSVLISFQMQADSRACVYMIKWSPMFCLWTATVAGRIFQRQVIFRMHTHTQAYTQKKRLLQTHSLFYGQGSCKTIGPVFLFLTTRQKVQIKRQRDRQVGLGKGKSLTDLMRGTLSSVQHKSGPLCKNSSSSHDWLYNL